MNIFAKLFGRKQREHVQYVPPVPRVTEVTDQDIKSIRDFMQAEAQGWWSSNTDNVACCDWYCDEGMGRTIERNDGYLLGRRLLCKQCCEKLLLEMSNGQQDSLPWGWVEDLLNPAREFNSRRPEHISNFAHKLKCPHW